VSHQHLARLSQILRKALGSKLFILELIPVNSARKQGHKQRRRKVKKGYFQDKVCSLVIEPLPTMHKALHFIPSSAVEKGVRSLVCYCFRQLLFCFRITLLIQVPVAHTCNPSCLGGRDQEHRGLKPAEANSSRNPVSKIPNTKREWW
jgi:hypothetical protein